MDDLSAAVAALCTRSPEYIEAHWNGIRQVIETLQSLADVATHDENEPLFVEWHRRYDSQTNSLKEFLAKKPEEAVGATVEGAADCRLVDLEGSDTVQAQFRRTLAARSFAHEYQAYNPERITEMIRGQSFTVKKKRARSVREFARQFSGRHEETARDAISFGIRLIVMEKAFGEIGISCILGFFKKALKTTSFASILCSFEASDELRSVVQQQSPWMTAAQQIYDAQRQRASTAHSSAATLLHQASHLPRVPLDDSDWMEFSQCDTQRAAVIMPFEAEVFHFVQKGDIENTLRLLRCGTVSRDTVDMYGLGLLYHACYYCLRGCGIVSAFNMCRALLDMDVNATFLDDTGSPPWMSLLDGLLCLNAMGTYSIGSDPISDVATIFQLDRERSWTCYLSSRNLTQAHRVLLQLDDPRSSWHESLVTLKNAGNDIDGTDNQGRSPLTWAVENGWVSATAALLQLGANPKQERCPKTGSKMPLLHLAIAGPTSAQSSQIVRLLLGRGADVHARDEEDWTALHIAASWLAWDIIIDLLLADADLNALTTHQQSALSLAVNAGADEAVRSLLSGLTRLVL